MDELRRFIIIIFGICISMIVNIMVLMYGWGLSVKSWWWVIGMYFIGHMFTVLMLKLGEQEKK